MNYTLTNSNPKPATPLDLIIELTFQDAVNGHLNDAQTITREEIGEVYEAARSAIAERAQLVAALRRSMIFVSNEAKSEVDRDISAMDGYACHMEQQISALLRSIGDAE